MPACSTYKTSTCNEQHVYYMRNVPAKWTKNFQHILQIQWTEIKFNCSPLNLDALTMTHSKLQ